MIVRTQKIRFSPDRKPMPRRMKLGFEGDNMVERLVFDLPAIAQSQTATLMMGGRYANAVQLAEDGEEYRIGLTAEIVGAEGDIEAYVRIDGADGEVWQSDVISFITGDVPDVETEIEQRFPTAVETMLQEMAGHRAEMEEQTQLAEDAVRRAEAAAESVAGATGDGKLDSYQGVENAGKLLYINADGLLVPLALGAGLEIRDGVLMVTGTSVVVAELTVDAGGNAVITGATLTVDDDGNCTITGAALTVDESGNAVLA